MVCMLYSTIPTPAGLAVYLAGHPMETRPDTPASSVTVYHPLLVHLHNLPSEGTWIGRTTTTSWTLLLMEGQQSDLENPLAALLARVPGSTGQERRTLGTRRFTVRTRTCQKQFFHGTWQARAFLFASSE